MDKMINNGSQPYILEYYSMEGYSNELDGPKGLDNILGKYSTFFNTYLMVFPRNNIDII